MGSGLWWVGIGMVWDEWSGCVGCGIIMEICVVSRVWWSVGWGGV